MKYIFYTFVFFLFVNFVQPVNTTAQTNKKENTRKDRKKKKNKNKPITSTAIIKTKAPLKPKYLATVVKQRYRIDFFIPIDLDKYVPNGKLNANAKSQDALKPYIQYYEGILIAAKTLAQDSMQLDIQIHEEKNGTYDINNLKIAKNLSSSDLIIGFVQSRDIPALASFAKENNINFISTFSPSDADIQDNPYFHILQPTYNTNFEVLIDFATKHYPKNKKFIFFQNDARGHEMNQLIAAALRKDKNIYSQMLNEAIIQKQPLMKFLDSTQTNVIFMPILPPNEVDKILESFAKLPANYKLEIFGSPTWKYLKSIKNFKNKENITLYYTTPFHYDTATANGKSVIQAYQSTFTGIPSEMVFRGYESTIWFASLLHKYGTIFNNNIDDLSSSPFTDYRFKSVEENGKIKYYENKHLYIIQVQNGNTTFVR